MKRFEVWLVNLDPTIGSEIRKTRPAVIASPDDLNQYLRKIIVVPLTTGKHYPFRTKTHVQEKEGIAAVDQMRAVDKRRLVKHIGTLNNETAAVLLNTIAQMFAP